MNHLNESWIADNHEITFSSTTNTEWYEYHHNFIVNYFEFVQRTQPNEIVIYSSRMDLYYKLGPKSLTYSKSLKGNYVLLYNGFWLKENEENKINSNNKIKKVVNELMTAKRKTEDLYNAILASEVTTDHFDGPFGRKKILYLDYTASGRPLRFIESCINEKVLPNYSNTHSDGNYLAEAISDCRNEYRETIRKCLNAKEGVDSLIFIGSGSTSAIHKLIGILNIPKDSPPIVIVSPYEHHSNLLPWREMGAEVEYANDADDTSIDLKDLEKKLRDYQKRFPQRLKIGTFTAASNVNGVLLDVEKISSLLHKYGFLTFWDYSTAAPHITIDMNPNDNVTAYKDAVFFSGHKFLGGPQTPGVLIAKNNLFKNQVPHSVGGGTVLLVSKNKQIYDSNNENREEGGTPAIIESIRLGLVFKFKELLNPIIIEHKEKLFTKKATEFLKNVPNMILLGNLKLERLPIFSFLIKNPETGFYLHYNYVTKLLNDLFGIQSRSGCACAGPYGHYLLGIDDQLGEKYLNKLVTRDQNSSRLNDYVSSKNDIIKPGFTRFNIPFFLKDIQVDFILNALAFICQHGWKFLPLYEFQVESGKFWHIETSRKSGHKIDIDLNSILNNLIRNPNQLSKSLSIVDEDTLNKCLADANKHLKSLDTIYKLNKDEFIDQSYIFDEYKNIRWFMLPSEAMNLFNKSSKITRVRPPFIPISYNDEYGHFNKINRSSKSKINDLIEWEKDFDRLWNSIRI